MASQETSGSMQKKNIGSPEETRSFDKGKLEVVKLPTATIGRGTFEPGWKWSECVKPIAQTDPGCGEQQVKPATTLAMGTGLCVRDSVCA
jgi:hypothetical protein